MKTDTDKKRRSRAYICHTYYHIYVTVLKELAGGEAFARDKADLFLSKMSDEILSPDLYERLTASGIFSNVSYLDEKKESNFPWLQKYKNPHASFFKKMCNRMAYARELPNAMAPFIQTDFSVYNDVYVYCDEDPIAYYLNYKKISYHALEDGLDCVVYCDVIINDDSRFLKLKMFLARRGLIFLPNGYSKYALDMEVNDLSRIKYPHKGWKEEPRENYVKKLTSEDRERLVRLFIPNLEALRATCKKASVSFSEDNAAPSADGAFLLLTQPLCDLVTRKRIFEDIIREYAKGAPVIIKPHPRDVLDYKKEFSSCLILDPYFPIEVLNFCEGIHFQTVMSVMTTAIDTIEFADNKINLGWSYLDPYEDPALHTYEN